MAPGSKYPCVVCRSSFTRKNSLKKHIDQIHNGASPTFECGICNSNFESSQSLSHHRKQEHIFNSGIFKKYKTAFQGSITLFRQDLNVNNFDEVFSSDNMWEMKKIIQDKLVNFDGVSFFLSTMVTFKRIGIDGGITQYISPTFSSSRKKYYRTTFESISFYLKEMREKILLRQEDFQLNGSGWTMDSVDFLDLGITKINALKGGCYIPEYENDINTRGLLNIRNIDDKCILYCILAFFYGNSYPSNRREEPETYAKYLSEINCDKVEFPFNVEDSELLELNNKSKSFQLNFYKSDGKKATPFYVREDALCDHIINILIFEKKIEKKIYRHFVLIKDTAKFFQKTYNNKKGGKTYGIEKICDKCLASYRSENMMQIHKEHCNINCDTVVTLPSADENIFKFTNRNYQYPHLFVGFVDFESALVPNLNIETCKVCTVTNNTNNKCEHSFTANLNTHKPISFSLIIINRQNKIVKEKLYTGDDSAEQFINTLLEFEPKIREQCQSNEVMIFTSKDKAVHYSSKKCHICKDVFNHDDVIVRDHCHMTGAYLGAAHKLCNLHRQERPIVKIFAHNFSSYDSHLFLSKMNDPRISNIKVIPKTTEKFLAISMNNMYTLLDSMSFLSGSLDSLVKNLGEEHTFPILSQWLKIKNCNGTIDKTKFNLMLQKSIFPYEFTTSIQKLRDTKTLPLQSEFYSKLNNSTPSKEEYQRGKTIFKTFKCRNMVDYMELYVNLDTILLAEVFLQFREQNLKQFQIDPCNFLTLPSLALQCFLKFSNVKFELLTDKDMYDMLQSNLRGGLSLVSERYAESSEYTKERMQKRERESPLPNHPLNQTKSKKRKRENDSDSDESEKKCRIMDAKYNECGQSSINDDGVKVRIIDVDCNNLYGCAQQYPLPIGGFEFLTADSIKKIDFKTVDLSGKFGYFVECDLNYPEEIWEKTASYPLCPININITQKDLSPYSMNVLKKAYNKTVHTSRKLTATFHPRKKIVLHGLNLQLWLELGMTLEKVYRVIKFRQEPSMKKWVDFCTSQRSKSRNSFEKDYWKLIVNSVFGKTIEDLARQRDVIIVRDSDHLSKLVSKPNFEYSTIIKDDLVIAVMKNESVVVKRPYYIGFSILELSKRIMYQFYYYHIQKYYGQNNVRCLYTDTDSLVLHVKTENIHKDLFAMRDNFDFSNLHTTHPLFSNENKAKLFRFKEEFGLSLVKRFVALRSKCYIFEIECSHDDGFDEKGKCKLKCDENGLRIKSTLKGIVKSAKATLTINNYLKCLKDSKLQRVTQTCIRSKKHTLTTSQVRKISLSCMDDKRYILDCGIHSKPYSYDKSSSCTQCN